MNTSPARLRIWSTVCVLLCYLGLASSASLSEWRSRSIYQVITDRFAYPDVTEIAPCKVVDGHFCGGTWKGIEANLDYIEGMGFDALWISPVVANLPQLTADGAAYTGYWQQNLYELNSNFGTANDLKDLIKELHDRDMYLMLDIVVNHMGYAGTSLFVDYDIFYPFNDQKYFHDYCEVDEPKNPENVERCWLGDWSVPLVDLKTEDEEVRKMFGDWISGMVSNYSIDGLRIDTSINVEADFFPGFVESAGVFATGEVLQGDDSIACKWADSIGSILNYPIYFTLTRAFQSEEGSIDDLVKTIDSVKENCKDPTAMGSFSENHDIPRFASYTDDMSLAKNIITYNFMSDGIPIIYQGQEQHMKGGISPYTNRAPMWETGFDTSVPLYKHIATLNKFRQHVLQTSKNYTTYMNEAIFQDYHSLAMRKGFGGSQVVTVLNNNGESIDDFNLEVPNHGFQAGVKLTEVLTCTNLTVNETGYINLPMGQGKPKIMYPTNLLYGSSLCGLPDKAPSGGSSTISQDITTSVDGHATTIKTYTVTEIPAVTTDGYVDVTAKPTAPPSTKTSSVSNGASGSTSSATSSAAAHHDMNAQAHMPLLFAAAFIAPIQFLASLLS